MTDTAGAGAHVEVELIQLHYLGELSFAQSDAIHQHIVGCPECGATAREIIDLLAALALGGDATTSPDDPPDR